MNAVLSMVMVSVTVTEARVAQVVQCEADHECGKDMYCYESQLCTPCTNCAVYNRKKPVEYPLCPTSAQQCGMCLEGYEDEILTDGSSRDTCQLSTSQDMMGINTLIYAVIGIAFFAFICFGAVFYVKRKKEHNNNNCNSEHSSSDPPPYIEGSSPLILQACRSTEVVHVFSDVEETHGSFQCSKDQLNQQAIPYITPEHPYGSGGEADDPGWNANEVDDNEDTIPSAWAPPLGYGNSSSSSSSSSRSSSMISLPEPFTDEDDESNDTNDSGTSEAGELQSPFGMFATSSSLPTIVPQSEPAAACSTCSLDDEGGYTQAPKRLKLATDSGTASMDDVPADSVEISTEVCKFKTV